MLFKIRCDEELKLVNGLCYLLRINTAWVRWIWRWSYPGALEGPEVMGISFPSALPKSDGDPNSIEKEPCDRNNQEPEEQGRVVHMATPAEILLLVANESLLLR